MALRTSGMALEKAKYERVKLVADYFGLSVNQVVRWAVDDMLGMETPPTYRDIVQRLREQRDIVSRSDAQASYM